LPVAPRSTSRENRFRRGARKGARLKPVASRCDEQCGYLALLRADRRTEWSTSSAAKAGRFVERACMIRDKRTWIAVNAAGAAAALFVVISWLYSPPTHLWFPAWVWQADIALVFGGFIYNIVRRLRGPIEPARWARNITDRQMWIVKGVLTAALIGGVFIVIALRVARP